MFSFGMIHICNNGLLLYCFLVFVVLPVLYIYYSCMLFCKYGTILKKNNAFKLLQLYCFIINKHIFKMSFIESSKIGLFCLLYNITHKEVIKWCASLTIYFPSHWKIQSEYSVVLSLKRILIRNLKNSSYEKPEMKQRQFLEYKLRAVSIAKQRK